MPKDLRWAAITLLDICQMPATESNIAAFYNPNGNEEWIKGIIKKASPVPNSTSYPFYEKAILILQANGINTNIYRVG